jgi:hypothetical protein
VKACEHLGKRVGECSDALGGLPDVMRTGSVDGCGWDHDGGRSINVNRKERLNKLLDFYVGPRPTISADKRRIPRS